MSSILLSLRKAWAGSPPLTFTAILMSVAFLLFAIGIVVDERVISGVPAWLKPAKFAISTAIFSATMIWLFRYIRIWQRFLRTAAWIISIVFVLEVAIIATQAARGTTSHFNASTPFDASMFAIMGSAILILWVTTAGIAAALFRQRFENEEWGRWLRMGMLISVLGSGMGGLMVRPTHEQLQMHPPSVVGAHTVGAADGGPGMPVVGWSLHHGDLRIPHFMGMHAIQVLPLLGWFFIRRQRRLAYAMSASYFALLAILTWQALRGQSILEHDPATLLAFAVWATGTLAALVPQLTLRPSVLAATR